MESSDCGIFQNSKLLGEDWPPVNKTNALALSKTLVILSSRNNQHYALISTTPLFYIMAPTCFGSSLPSSGSLLDPSELLKIQIE
jgi:hypothetical protein